MYQFVWESSFLRAYKKVIKINPNLKSKINETMALLQDNPYHPKLKTHKLHGKLNLLLASSVDYDYRMVFLIKEIESRNYIVLVDIGTHYEVYWFRIDRQKNERESKLGHHTSTSLCAGWVR